MTSETKVLCGWTLIIIPGSEESLKTKYHKNGCGQPCKRKAISRGNISLKRKKGSLGALCVVLMPGDK